MSDHAVIVAAMAKRTELVSEIETLESDLRQRVIDLRSLDATLRLFSPDIELSAVMPQPFPPQHHAARGEVKTIIVEALSKSAQPLTSTYLTEVVMKRRGLALGNRTLRTTIRKRIVSTMTYLKDAGVVRQELKQGQRIFWVLTGPVPTGSQAGA
jgi:hypothetical protein